MSTRLKWIEIETLKRKIVTNKPESKKIDSCNVMDLSGSGSSISNQKPRITSSIQHHQHFSLEIINEELESNTIYGEHDQEIEKLFQQDQDHNYSKTLDVNEDHETEIERILQKKDERSSLQNNLQEPVQHNKEASNNYEDHEVEIERILQQVDERSPSQNNLQQSVQHNKEVSNNYEDHVVVTENHNFSQDGSRQHSPSILLEANESCVAFNSDTDYIPSSDKDSSDDNINTGRKRRRVAKPDKWKRQMAKNLRMQGKEYTGFLRVGNKILHNQPRAARKMGPKCDLRMCSKTNKRQCNSLTENDRKKVFKMFWSKLDWKQRKIYVINHVHQSVPLRRYTKHGGSRREGTLFYYLTIGNDKMQVCKKNFSGNFGNW